MSLKSQKIRLLSKSLRIFMDVVFFLTNNDKFEK